MSMFSFVCLTTACTSLTVISYIVMDVIATIRRK